MKSTKQFLVRIKAKSQSYLDKQKNQKMGLKQLVWLGFNYTCNLAFAYTLSSTYAGKDGAGLHLIWIILLSAIVAGGTAWAFAKCSSVFSDANGGVFEYTRRTFGTFHGWIVGYFQYILYPITVPATILVAITVSFAGLYKPDMWGSPQMTLLYLNLISILMYITISMLFLFGSLYFRILTNATSFIKWIVLILLYIGSVIIMVRTHGNYFQHSTKVGHLNAETFNNAFTSFFYSFIGFETVATVGESIKNPKKTMPRALMLIVVLGVVFYIVGFIFIVGSLSGLITANPINDIIKSAMGGAALIVVAISFLAQNINLFLQNAFYNVSMLQPLAKHNMVYAKLSVTNKRKVAVYSLLVNTALTSLFSIIWLVLPMLLHTSNFQYISIIQFNSFITFGLMIYAILTTLKLRWYHKIRLHWITITLFVALLGFFGYEAVIYVVAWKEHLWQIIMFVACLLFGIVWYFAWVRKKYIKAYKLGLIDKVNIKTDLPDWKNNPDLNDKLQKKSVLLDAEEDDEDNFEHLKVEPNHGKDN